MAKQKTRSIKSKRRLFERTSVLSPKGLKKRLSPTGYEAIRISPRTTKKYGKQYRKIYGATIEPDYSRGKSGKFGANVKWYPHLYTTKGAKSGTRILQPIKNYPVNQKEAKMKLMLKSRKRKASKKRTVKRRL